MGPSPDEQVSAVELLKRTPLSQLEETVRALKNRRAAGEVRKAMVERIARAPLSEFETLKTIYLKHCADAAK
jgi:16S rRNA C1402 N4-methylase RsmH